MYIVVSACFCTKSYVFYVLYIFPSCELATGVSSVVAFVPLAALWATGPRLCYLLRLVDAALATTSGLKSQKRCQKRETGEQWIKLVGPLGYIKGIIPKQLYWGLFNKTIMSIPSFKQPGWLHGKGPRFSRRFGSIESMGPGGALRSRRLPEPRQQLHQSPCRRGHVLGKWGVAGS